MKLIYIANIRLPTEKAHGIQIMKMCEAFASTAELNVELIVPWRFNKIKEDPFIYYGVEKKFTITRIPSLDLISLGRIGFWVQAGSFAFFAFFYGLLSRKVGVIYSRDELPVFLFGFFKNNIFWEMHTKKENFFTDRALSGVQGVILITQGLRDFYLAKGVNKNKIFVAPDGVDVQQFYIEKNKIKWRVCIDLPEDKKIIGYVGKYKTMGELKSDDDLIISFSEVLISLQNAFLLLVGINENEVGELKNIFQRVGVKEECYKIVTHVPQREAFLYMKASDALVMNYPDTPHYALYMSPLKLFEYMASGVPIITSDLPSVREILNENNSLIVKEHGYLGLAKGVVLLLENKDFSAKIAEQAYKDVQNYTWEKRATTILSFMRI